MRRLPAAAIAWITAPLGAVSYLNFVALCTPNASNQSMHASLLDSSSPRVCSPTTSLDSTEQFAPGIGPAPVATRMMSVNGLYGMGANVWEWTENEDLPNKSTRDGFWWRNYHEKRSPAH